MSQTLVELFQETINEDLHLKGEDESWSLKDTPKMTMLAPSEDSLCFSLDSPRLSPLSDLFPDPPRGVVKVCDAIIVLSHKNKDYIFIVEQKTSREGHYKKQLANGKYFCDWVLALLKEHRWYDGEVVFIFLLCWQPREKLPRKGESHHRNMLKGEPFGSDGLPQDVKNGLFYEVRNESNIHLSSFIE